LTTLDDFAAEADPPISRRTLYRLVAAGELRPFLKLKRARGQPVYYDRELLLRVHAEWFRKQVASGAMLQAK
jgi:hypothetical protein